MGHALLELPQYFPMPSQTYSVLPVFHSSQFPQEIAFPSQAQRTRQWLDEAGLIEDLADEGFGKEGDLASFPSVDLIPNWFIFSGAMAPHRAASPAASHLPTDNLTFSFSSTDSI